MKYPTFCSFKHREANDNLSLTIFFRFHPINSNDREQKYGVRCQACERIRAHNITGIIKEVKKKAVIWKQLEKYRKNPSKAAYDNIFNGLFSRDHSTQAQFNAHGTHEYQKFHKAVRRPTGSLRAGGLGG